MTNKMKIYNDVGCIIEGIDEDDLDSFKDAGWMTEEEYFKLHPKEKEE